MKKRNLGGRPPVDPSIKVVRFSVGLPKPEFDRLNQICEPGERSKYIREKLNLGGI